MIEALYIHIPFCVQRCAYCDFPTRAESDGAAMDAYVESLGMQLRRASRAGLLGGVRTIYIGGGTPTHLGSRRLVGLAYLISLSVNLENVVEFTVECNPESLDAAMVRDLFALGVNRFSIGAQSFDDAVLAEYGRAHNAADISRAVAAVRQRCENFSLDLICGGSGQNTESWKASVRAAIELGAKHVSVYPLTVEPGTPLAKRVEAGECSEPSDDLQADMMLAAASLLGAAGFRRYEVASYALPGFESRHNTAYWTGVEYLGLGAAAASMLAPETYVACLEAGVLGAVPAHECASNQECSPYQGKSASECTPKSSVLPLPGGAVSAYTQLQVCHPEQRSPQASASSKDPAQNALFHSAHTSSSADANVCARIRYTAAFGVVPAELEILTVREAALEDVMLGFRRSAGVSQAQIAAAAELEPRLPATIERVCRLGLVTELDGHLVPTQLGWLCGNELYGAIWGLA